MYKYYFLNILIYPIEIIIKFYLLLFSKKKPNFVILVIGNYASSTTLWLQILITLFKINYINNISSKFYICILFGQLVNKLLRLFNFKVNSTFYSEDGIAKGLMEPNEFGWYWRNFFTKEPTNQKIKNFCENLNNFTDFSGLPFLFKYSMTSNINPLKKNYKYFKSIKKNLIIIYPYRKKKLVVNSILNRKKNLKEFNSTYNFKKDGTLNKSIHKQVQRIYNEHSSFLSNFNKKQILYINFEKFKNNKTIEIKKIVKFFKKFDIEMNDKIYIKKNLKNIKFKKNIKKEKL